jgi:hypothetical protein
MYLKRLLFPVLFVCTLLAGCKENEITPRNQIIKDGLSYEIDKGALVGYGKMNDGDVGNSLHLYLMSPDVTIAGKNEVPDSLTGKGHLITFTMFSSQERELVSGTYQFDGYETTNPETFGNASTIFNANYTNKTGNEHKLIAGKVIVKRDGEVYKLDFDGVDDTGKSIIGHYTGTLSYFKGN